MTTKVRAWQVFRRPWVLGWLIVVLLGLVAVGLDLLREWLFLSLLVGFSLFVAFVILAAAGKQDLAMKTTILMIWVWGLPIFLSYQVTGQDAAASWGLIVLLLFFTGWANLHSVVSLYHMVIPPTRYITGRITSTAVEFLLEKEPGTVIKSVPVDSVEYWFVRDGRIRYGLLSKMEDSPATLGERPLVAKSSATDSTGGGKSAVPRVEYPFVDEYDLVNPEEFRAALVAAFGEGLSEAERKSRYPRDNPPLQFRLPWRRDP